MSRIALRFQELKSLGRKGLIPYVTAGDPSPQMTVSLMHAMVAAGADFIELGVPFSDPMADGPVIQAACERALKHGISLSQVLDLVKSFRQQDVNTPVVLMGYLNPIEVMGYQSFAQAAVEAGVDGLITVDLPPEEAGDLITVLRQAKLDPIFLIAPTSHARRIESICNVASGFVYYVSLKGVTGASTLDVASVDRKLKEIRKCARTPIGVGFGIKDADSAARVAKIADAVVVGTALVKLIAAHESEPDEITEKISMLLKSMRVAMDNVSAGDKVA